MAEDRRHDASEAAPLGRAAPSSEVVRRAATGDRAAQEALLVAHLGRIRRRVRRLVGASGEADDLVQQACVELLRSIARYRGDASLELWIDRITTHVVYKFFRTSGRRARRVTVAEDVDRAGPEDAERRLEWREGLDAAGELLDRLRPERRIVFLLVAVEGRSLAETAAMLDLSLPAAKSRYLRARHDVDRLVACTPRLATLLEREEARR
ncbi:MAG: RNA polymerase sigma factor [Sandaracinaceae bacterium]|nr:RNA polymerase sigma factor [Sandaracinaceae bacterium]